MLIVVPDDNPPVLAGTPALDRLRTIGEVRLYDSDATDPKILAERLAKPLHEKYGGHYGDAESYVQRLVEGRHYES